MIIGEGIDGETHALTLFHATDVSLVDIGNHAHVGQILSDAEQFRGVERGSHRLTFLHRLRQYHTVDR